MARILEGRNRASAEEAASFAAEIDRIEQAREAKIAELDAEFKKRKRDLHKQFDGDQASIYDDAKKQGVAKGTLKAIIAGQSRIRKAEEKVEAAKEAARDGLDNLEDEARDQAVDIVKALGADFAGFGLGAAAVERAEQPADGTDPVAAAADRAWNEADPKKGKAAKH
jgi:flagellar biosynthesis/type III secretory pathway protein FliH